MWKKRAGLEGKTLKSSGHETSSESQLMDCSHNTQNAIGRVIPNPKPVKGDLATQFRSYPPLGNCL